MDSHTPNHHGAAQERGAAEPVRSRWIPKPEQILILESIFNSGMVNPPKDETIRIRKLLEKFGSVGDANVFYWFQNRRSRSRRRQRQMQAEADLAASSPRVPNSSGTSSSNSSCSGFFPSPSTTSSPSSSSFVRDDAADDLFSISRQMGLMQNSQMGQFMCASDLHYQTGTITVFINGIPSEFPGGPIDMRAMFGQDVMLVHSSGELLPVNEYGILLQSLQMGESYFLVRLKKETRTARKLNIKVLYQKYLLFAENFGTHYKGIRLWLNMPSYTFAFSEMIELFAGYEAFIVWACNKDDWFDLGF